MLVRSAVAVMLCFGFFGGAQDQLWAVDAPAVSAAATADSGTAESVDSSASGARETTPTDRKTVYPTAAELAEKIVARRQRDAALPVVAHIDLNEPLLEKPSEFAFLGEEDFTLQSLLSRIDQAVGDDTINAILITCGATQINLAQAQEIRSALQQAKNAGKKVFVYADSYDSTLYAMASSASDICMLEGGELLMPGVGIEALFARGLLDKIGVQADYVQIGEYKGADEQLTRTSPSPELTQELNRLADGLFDQLVDGISRYRNLPRQQVVDLIDQALIPSSQALEAGLVDHLVDPDGLRQLMAGSYNQKRLNIIKDYGAAEKTELDFSNIFVLLSQLMKTTEPVPGPQVAIVYAQGVIVDGQSDTGLFDDPSVGSEDIRQAMRQIAMDPQIKAVVIRIDSPGGSATASEAMWQAVRRLARSKPVVVSVGSMAASGGYYLASSAEHIIADPTAIVGSIEVVGGKFVVKDLYGKLGLNTQPFTRGANADLFSSNAPFSDKQRQMVTQWMSQTYDQFTRRILTTRSQKIGDIDRVARGRIFLAEQALTLGLVDEIGGLQDAVRYAADQADLNKGEYTVSTVPAPASLSDLINRKDRGAELMRPRMGLPDALELLGIAPQMRRPIVRQLRALQLLQQRPVILFSPYLVQVR